MTATHSAERRARTSGEHPLSQVGPERQRQWYLIVGVAILAAVLGFGIGSLVFSDDGAAASDRAEFPIGRFVNEQFETRFFEFNADGTYMYSESAGP